MNNKLIILNFCNKAHEKIFLSLFLALFIFCGTKGSANGLVARDYWGTGNSLEMTIDGDGLFILKGTNDNVYYSRYGAFYLDNEGYLVNNLGYRLQGYILLPEGSSAGFGAIHLNGVDINDIEVSSDGIISYNDGSGPVNISQIALARFLSPQNLLTLNISQLALTKFLSPQNLSTHSFLLCKETARSGQPIISIPGTSGIGMTQAGVLEGAYECDRGSMFFNKRISINGKGYFRLIDNGTVVYTRKFPLGTDKNGYLVNQSGYRVTGYGATSSGNIVKKYAKLNFTTLASPPSETESVDIFANLDSRELIPAAFNVTDPANTSNISSAITVYDSLGNSHVINVYFRKDTEASTGNIWEWFAVVNDTDSDSGITEIQAQGTLGFDSNGALDWESAITYPVKSGGWEGFQFNCGAMANQLIDFDFGTAIATDGGTGLDGTTQFAASSAIISQNQGGYPSGYPESFDFQPDGTIVAYFSNGQSRVIGKLVLAKFPDPSKLVRHDKYTWEETDGSGSPTVKTPDKTGYGNIQVEDIL
jgi:flagellar hook protein FlgE